MVEAQHVAKVFQYTLEMSSEVLGFQILAGERKL